MSSWPVRRAGGRGNPLEFSTGELAKMVIDLAGPSSRIVARPSSTGLSKQLGSRYHLVQAGPVLEALWPAGGRLLRHPCFGTDNRRRRLLSKWLCFAR